MHFHGSINAQRINIVVNNITMQLFIYEFYLPLYYSNLIEIVFSNYCEFTIGIYVFFHRTVYIILYYNFTASL